VIVLKGGNALTRCLTALSGQTNVSDVEIIVPYDDNHNLDSCRTQFPDVRWLAVQGDRTYAELRTKGVLAARGAVVALTEDHCVPRPAWCATLLKEHEAAHAAVGGAVDKLTPDTALNWSLYLADYVRYANPAPAGTVDHLTDCNVSYKRAALDPIAGVWAHEFHEPEVHAALREQGGALWLSPGVVVDQQRSMTLRDAVRDRYAFGRLFGGRRVEALSLGQRLVYAGTALALPVLLVGRVVGHVLEKRRYLGALLRAFPFVLLLNSVWAWGEFLGYLTGRAATSLTPGQGQRAVLQTTPEQA